MMYGLPYKGSKNTIAEWVVDNLPSADNFYDLFCGGCAITHRAILTKKYKSYVINDINPQMPKFFQDAINGAYKDECRWISRSEFEMLKEYDAYVRFCWSFGDNGESYLYGKEVEPYKQAYWNVLFAKSLPECKAAVKQLLRLLVDSSEQLSKYDEGFLLLLESLKRLQRVQSLERLQRELNNTLMAYTTNYYEVPIKNNSVIYCDIPYRNTDGYNDKKFDYEAFYTWAESQSEPVYISEYWMPEDRFDVVAEIQKVVSLQGGWKHENRKIVCAKKSKENKCGTN